MITTTYPSTVEDRVALVTAVNVWDIHYGELTELAMEMAGEVPGIFQSLDYAVPVLEADARTSNDQARYRMARDVIADAAKRAHEWVKANRGEQPAPAPAPEPEPAKTGQALIAERLEQYVDTLNKSARDAGIHRDDYTTQAGRRYVKVVHDHSVHAFVDPATGAVYKPAGWSKPAEHVRYWLGDDASFALLIERAADPHSFSGGYLYMGP